MRGCPGIFQSWLDLPPDVQGIRIQAVDTKELHRKGQFPLPILTMQIKHRETMPNSLYCIFRSSMKCVSLELKSLIKEGFQRF